MEPHSSGPASPVAHVRWDPRDYASHSASQLEWARELISRIGWRGDESVLDLGCGDGKVTAEIARRVPRGKVRGIDSSPEMITFARRTFSPSELPNLEFACMDARSFQTDHRFNLVFSNAALHWVDDHRAVLRQVFAHLVENGRLFVSCGGSGNAARLVGVLNDWIREAPWQPFFADFRFPYFFYGTLDYERWLKEAGFTSLRVALVPKDMAHSGAEGLAAWVRTAWLPYTQRVPEELQASFIEGVVQRYLMERPLDAAGKAHVEMVRLEVEAVNRVWR